MPLYALWIISLKEGKMEAEFRLNAESESFWEKVKDLVNTSV